MRRMKLITISLILLLFVGVFSVQSLHVLANKSDKVSKLTEQTSTNKKSVYGAAITSSINNTISNDPDGLSAAVSIIDLNSNQEIDSGATTTLFKAASTAKVLAAVDYLRDVQNGQASLDQQIDGTSAEQLIQQMIEVSDDNAWTDINNYLGDQQQSYANQIGLSSFTGGEYNTMYASDMAKLLAMLYQGKLLDNYYKNILLNFMANTTSTNLIQAVLPPNATVYHKYGQVWGYLNDAAIVDYQKHQYVLVIFTNSQDGTTDEYSDQVNLIQQISQQVFQDVLNNKV